ncbi:MAG: SPASM domain-containing protein [Nocardioides sp.]
MLWASVSYDGRFRHCPHSSVYAGHASEGLAQLWAERVQPTVRAALTPTGACGSCSQLSACGGGCHLSKIVSYGTVGVPSPTGGRPLLPILPITATSGGGS